MYAHTYKGSGKVVETWKSDASRIAHPIVTPPAGTSQGIIPVCSLRSESLPSRQDPLRSG